MSLTPETHIFKTVTDCDLKIDVYRSAHAPDPAPVIMWLHGGALINGRRKDPFPWQVELYLNHGYTVASPDYRLAPETKLPQIIQDLQDAFRWLRVEGPDLLSIDPNRVAVAGSSAGGYLALMAGFCLDPLPRAIISFYGYGDIIGDWYSKPDPFYCNSQPLVSQAESGWPSDGHTTTKPYPERGLDKFYLYCRQTGLWPEAVTNHDPHTQAPFFTPYCPLQNVTDAYPPTCLLHGTDDTDVPYQQSELMAQALTDHNVDHKFITMNGKGHCFDANIDAPMVKEAFDQVLAFLDKHLS